jgi:hypothetical protein
MMHMSPSELFSLTLAEFSAAYQGWQRQREADERSMMDRTRWLAAAIIGPWMKSYKSVTELFPMPWDKTILPEKSEELDIEARRARVAEILAKSHE